jgi:hypothetical protein
MGDEWELVFYCPLCAVLEFDLERLQPLHVRRKPGQAAVG